MEKAGSFPIDEFLGTLLSREMVYCSLLSIAIAILLANSKLFTTKACKNKRSVHRQQKRAMVCPFTQESNFEVETAEHLPPSPLDLLDHWLDKMNASGDSEYPLAALWLEADVSGQDTPGILRAGLKRLRNSKHFLIEEDCRIRHELLLKEKNFNDPESFPLVFAEEPDSLLAQQECLELFLSYLPLRYPHLYSYNESANTLRVEPLDGRVFHIKEWMETRPLELCGRIVQEDLVLMRPPRNPSDGKHHEGYCMAAAVVVFSFSDLQEKLGTPVELIHAPVPGYQKHLRKNINLTFGKLLKTEAPLWRNNWAIAPTGVLDGPVYGSEVNQDKCILSTPTVELLNDMFLSVEYQTIRRLPKTGNLLFTVRTMRDPLHSLEHFPKAAACLACSLRGMSPTMRAYKGIRDDDTKDALLLYLDRIASKGKKLILEHGTRQRCEVTAD